MGIRIKRKKTKNVREKGEQILRYKQIISDRR